MTSLADRLSHLFPKGEFERSDKIAQRVRITCPRVGIVKASVTMEGGEPCEVEVELSAGRRGGMTLESRSSSQLGRRGTPCAALAAVLKEVDRRELFSIVADHTPIVLQCVADESPSDANVSDHPAEDEPEVVERPSRQRARAGKRDDSESGESSGDETAIRATALRGRSAAHQISTAVPQTHQRQPAWAVELDDRRRLVEPVIRSRGVSLPITRRDSGGLVFVLELSGGLDSRIVQLAVARLQTDVTGGTTGRLRPASILLERLDELEPDERECVARLLGSQPVTAAGRPSTRSSAESDASTGVPDESTAERSISRITLS
ncbi:MAG: hypothetical protein ACKOCN_04405, partial [Planctomycetaceae bacterium]